MPGIPKCRVSNCGKPVIENSLPFCWEHWHVLPSYLRNGIAHLSKVPDTKMLNKEIDMALQYIHSMNVEGTK